MTLCAFWEKLFHCFIIFVIWQSIFLYHVHSHFSDKVRTVNLISHCVQGYETLFLQLGAIITSKQWLLEFPMHINETSDSFCL